MPFSTAGPVQPRTVGGPFAGRSKAQELRAGLLSNSLRFLTPGRAEGVIDFGANGLNPPAAGDSAEAFSYSYNRHGRTGSWDPGSPTTKYES